MGSHAGSIGKPNLSLTAAMLLEEMSQVSGEGSQAELVNFILIGAKPGGQEQLNVDIQKCKIVMSGGQKDLSRIRWASDSLNHLN
jgi:hypothetical protein